MSQRSSALAGLALAGVFLSLLWLEGRRPLRDRVEPRKPRLARNVAIGATAAAVVAATEAPVTSYLARQVERRRLGLVPRLGLSPGAQRLVCLLLLDYTLYLWHILLHRLPALWRWHQVHHRDPDLDVSTALRFHAMEMIWSLPWRMAQIVLIGVSRRNQALWGQLALAEVMFHHSNLRLPARLERLLGILVVTPSQHGIHHANVEELQHSNFSSGLSVWDHVHGTARRGVPQDRITIGLPQAQAQLQERVPLSAPRPRSGARRDSNRGSAEPG
jgi:sterol desaturase/sphingolipid hydroxylase (fatty acid hydroxylase superfamily)